MRPDRKARTPLHSTVRPDGLTAWLLQAPPDVAEAFANRVATLQREGHTPMGAERIAYREWTEGNL